MNVGTMLRIVGSLSRCSIRLMSSSSMSGRLDGKVAVVTASTNGIGLAIARRLAQDGAKVMVSSRKAKNVEATVSALRQENLQVEGTVCHVGKTDDRTSLLKKTEDVFGGIDILVSNAGINPTFGNILNTSEDQWDRIFDINVKSAFFLTKEAVPYLEKRGGGSVVMVASASGYIPFEFLGPYSVSKTALIGLVKALTPQLARMNIRVNAIAPGVIKTNFSEPLYNNKMVSDKMLPMIPLRRFGESEECAGTVSFLVSDDAKYIVGETVLITGGITARL